ncbi:MAG TPA: hypothetical protein VGF22_23650, partial [Acidimicrobiales bacterium]
GLAKVDQWVQQFATGVVLIAALALTGYQVRRAGADARRARARSGPAGPTPATEGPALVADQPVADRT